MIYIYINLINEITNLVRAKEDEYTNSTCSEMDSSLNLSKNHSCKTSTVKILLHWPKLSQKFARLPSNTQISFLFQSYSDFYAPISALNISSEI